jgi:hypothetical protein
MSVVVLGMLALACHANPVSAQSSCTVSGSVVTCPDGENLQGVYVHIFKNGTYQYDVQTNSSGVWSTSLSVSGCDTDWVTATIRQNTTLWTTYTSDYTPLQKGEYCTVQRASLMNCTSVNLNPLQFRCGEGADPCPSQ